jgi:hypothetical protein
MKSKSDNGNHTISQIEPINEPISYITDKQQTSSPLSRRPPHPHPPSPTTVAILPAESLSGRRDTTSNFFNIWSVASVEQVQVKPR